MRLPAAIAAAILGTPAFAGGLAGPEPSPVVVSPVVAVPDHDWSGFYGGAQLGYGDVRDDLNGDGAVGGVHAGYMWDFGGWVAGGEVDYDLADIGLDGGGSLDSIARLKLRAGADLGRTLVYGTAGLAQAQAEVGGADLDDTGWLAGIGMSYRLSENWTLGGEILGHRFEDFDGTGADVEAATATARMSFRF